MKKLILLAFLLITGLANLRADDVSAVTAMLDGQFVTAWKSAGIEPAPPVDDARYLRRI